MLITLKNLQQQTFQVDIDPSKTIRELKLKINSEKGNDYPADQQRLIYAGKILADDRPVSEYNIDEKKFIVVMVTQPKAPAAPHTGPADPTNIQPDKGDTSEKKTTSASTPSEQRQETGTGGSAGGTSSLSADAESALIMGEQYNSMVQNIVELGYDRDQVEKALRASFNNPDRAVEYLISGIPPDPDLQEQPSQGEENEPLGFLRNQPQFQQMRQVVQQNPELLNAVLQQIGQSNPALLQLISQNQEAFVRMLNEPVSGSTPAAPASTGGGGNTGGAPAQPNVTQVPVTPQDKEAIERLKALGFPEHLVVQAYFACEKNENLAANFLLSQNMDD